MKKEKSLTKKIIAISMILLLFICVFSYLCSIRFRVQYIFHFSIDTHDFINFNEHQNDFEKLIYQIDSVIGEDKQFFDKYEEYCDVDENGIIFYDRTLNYPYNKVTFGVSSSDWEDTRKCIYSFPDRGFGTISFDTQYPEYVFFTSQEYTSRFFVYTRDGRLSNKFLDEYWDEYEFVKVIKLSYGWYDIRPIGKR